MNEPELQASQEAISTESGLAIDGLSCINESLSKHFLIYKITNNLNGKYYIGQYQTDNALDDYSRSDSYLGKDKESFGLSAFTKTIE